MIPDNHNIYWEHGKFPVVYLLLYYYIYYYCYLLDTSYVPETGQITVEKAYMVFVPMEFTV